MSMRILYVIILFTVLTVAACHRPRVLEERSYTLTWISPERADTQQVRMITDGISFHYETDHFRKAFPLGVRYTFEQKQHNVFCWAGGVDQSGTVLWLNHQSDTVAGGFDRVIRFISRESPQFAGAFEISIWTSVPGDYIKGVLNNRLLYHPDWGWLTASDGLHPELYVLSKINGVPLLKARPILSRRR